MGWKSVHHAHTTHFKKIYELDLNLSDYLNCRFNLIACKRMQQLLPERLWSRFKKEVYENFNKEVGKDILYKGTVDFYVCGLAWEM